MKIKLMKSLLVGEAMLAEQNITKQNIINMIMEAKDLDRYAIRWAVALGIEKAEREYHPYRIWIVS